MVSPRVEEFFNHFHSPKDGKFSIGGAPGRYKSGPGKGLFSIAKTSKRGPKHSLLGFKPHARQSFSTPYLEEFYNHVHDSATGRFSGKAASGRAGFREGSHSGRGISTGTVAKSHDAYLNVGGRMVGVSPKAYDKWRAAGKPPIQNQGHLNRVAGQEQGPAGRLTGHTSKVVSRNEAIRTVGHYRGGSKKAYGAKIIAAMSKVGKPASHKKTEVSPGQVYTSLKGSHTIRQTKSGKMVLHTKNSAPQVVSKAAAAHVKKLDQHQVTAAEAVRGKIARWNAKG